MVVRISRQAAECKICLTQWHSSLLLSIYDAIYVINSV